MRVMPSLRISMFALTVVVAPLHITHGQTPAPSRGRVGVNHFYVIPDSASYAAMSASTFLRDSFAPFEERTTVRRDETYHGIYFYGEKTYFEFLPPSASRPTGSSGLAFGVDESGQIQAINDRIYALGAGRVGINKITRAVGSTSVDWFSMVVQSDPRAEANFVTWLMEYDTTFLARWFPTLAPRGGGVTRADILTRYVAKVDRLTSRERLPMRDVARLSIGLADTARASFGALVGAYGVPRNIRPDTPGFAADGVTLLVSDGRRGKGGIYEVTFRLRRAPSGPRERRFGTTILRITDDSTAVWRFREP